MPSGAARHVELERLARDIRAWGRELGFAEIGISDTELSAEEAHLLAWLDMRRHGDMHYMARHGARRARPAELVPGTLRVISARLDYLPPHAQAPEAVLADSRRAYVARYALGRDYHKVMRGKLRRLVKKIRAAIGPFNYRVFTDSAPVLEVALAARPAPWPGQAHAVAHPRRGLSSWRGLPIFRSRRRKR
jgi:epoxyqueuosine reductase